jgi:NAD(P)-dependent dehydrogenase (short-subunit alcohol dehydrogenase family)
MRGAGLDDTRPRSSALRRPPAAWWAARRPGAIINISSGAPYRGSTRATACMASKLGIVAIGRANPSRRLAEPDDIADVVVFPATDAARCRAAS